MTYWPADIRKMTREETEEKDCVHGVLLKEYLWAQGHPPSKAIDLCNHEACDCCDMWFGFDNLIMTPLGEDVTSYIWTPKTRCRECGGKYVRKIETSLDFYPLL